MTVPGPVVETLEASAYTFPTEEPESDGTLSWDSTTLVLVEATSGGHTGLGYSYTSSVAAELIRRELAGVTIGRDAMDVTGRWEEMIPTIRNLGRSGVVAAAVAAVDNALWDLKARLLDLPLCRLLGMVRPTVPLYGSGGFTSYDLDRLRGQLSDWVARGFNMVKMKVGRQPEHDVERVAAAREAIGDDVGLFVDANGAYRRKQALEMAWALADQGVTWFEEPVTSDDLSGLRLIRDQAPPGMDIAAGEYGFDLFYFRDMLAAGSVDVLQVDVTRCGGITTFLRTAALCRAETIPISSHTAPAQHLHVACAVPHLAHMEYFHDHVLIESALFEGVPRARKGALHPDLTRPGIGLEVNRAVAGRHRVT